MEILGNHSENASFKSTAIHSNNAVLPLVSSSFDYAASAFGSRTSKMNWQAVADLKAEEGKLMQSTVSHKMDPTLQP